MPRRNVSTTALQALNLLNGPFVVQQAGLFAERLQREAGDDAGRHRSRRRFLARLRPRPDDDELAAATALVASSKV